MPLSSEQKADLLAALQEIEDSINYNSRLSSPQRAALNAAYRVVRDAINNGGPLSAQQQAKLNAASKVITDAIDNNAQFPPAYKTTLKTAFTAITGSVSNGSPAGSATTTPSASGSSSSETPETATTSPPSSTLTTVSTVGAGAGAVGAAVPQVAKLAGMNYASTHSAAEMLAEYGTTAPVYGEGYAAAQMGALEIGGAALGAIGGSIGTFMGVQGMMQNGVTAMGVITTAISAGVGFYSILTLLAPLIGTGYGAIVAAVIIIAMVVLGMLLGGKKKAQSLGRSDLPPSSETAASTGPTGWLWRQAIVIPLFGGAALMALGINLAPGAPAYQVINVPAVSVAPSGFNVATLRDALQRDSHQSLPANPVGDVFYLKGTQGHPDRAVIVSPGQNGGDVVTTVTLDRNGNIIGPWGPNNSYVPHTQYTGQGPTGLTPTQAATTAVYNQNGGLALSASPQVAPAGQSAALNFGAASSHAIGQAGDNGGE